jgi:hypothetical protein
MALRALVTTGFWPGNLGHVANRVIENLLVADRLADTHVQGDLGDARHFHDGLVAELLAAVRGHRLFVNSCKRAMTVPYASTTSPFDLNTRTLRPSSSA